VVGENYRQVSRSPEMPAEEWDLEQGGLGCETKLDWQVFQKKPVIEHAQMISDKNITTARFDVFKAFHAGPHSGHEENEICPVMSTPVLKPAGAVDQGEKDT
jgi:hypothetical protein